MERFCAHCGKALMERAKFCIECGAEAEGPDGSETVLKLPTGLEGDLDQGAKPGSPLLTLQAESQDTGGFDPAHDQGPARNEQRKQQRRRQQAPKEPLPRKKNGSWILPYRIISSALAVLLLITGTIGIRNRSASREGVSDGFSSASSVYSDDGDVAEDFLSFDDGIATVDVDIGSLDRAFLSSQTIYPSGQEQAISLGEATLHLPEGFASQDMVVSLSEIQSMAGLEGLDYGKVYDLSVGESGELGDTIGITIPYDANAVSDPKNELIAARWDETSGFVGIPFTVNEANSTITAYTDHLCPIALVPILYKLTAGTIVYSIAAKNAWDWVKRTDIGRFVLGAKYTSPNGHFHILFDSMQMLEKYDPDRAALVRRAVQSIRTGESIVTISNGIDPFMNPKPPKDIYTGTLTKEEEEATLNLIKENYIMPPEGAALLERLGRELDSYYESYRPTELTNDDTGYWAMMYDDTLSTKASEFGQAICQIRVKLSDYDSKAGSEEMRYQLAYQVFETLLGRMYGIDTFAKEYSVYGFFTPLKYLMRGGESPVWLKSVCRYAAETYALGRSADQYKKSVSTDFLRHDLESSDGLQVVANTLSHVAAFEDMAAIVPYFIDKVLGMHLGRVIYSVFSDVSGSTYSQVARACGYGENYLAFYTDFVSFYIDGTDFKKIPNNEISAFNDAPAVSFFHDSQQYKITTKNVAKSSANLLVWTSGECVANADGSVIAKPPSGVLKIAVIYTGPVEDGKLRIMQVYEDGRDETIAAEFDLSNSYYWQTGFDKWRTELFYTELLNLPMQVGPEELAGTWGDALAFNVHNMSVLPVVYQLKAYIPEINYPVLESLNQSIDPNVAHEYSFTLPVTQNYAVGPFNYLTLVVELSDIDFLPITTKAINIRLTAPEPPAPTVYKWPSDFLGTALSEYKGTLTGLSVHEGTQGQYAWKAAVLLGGKRDEVISYLNGLVSESASTEVESDGSGNVVITRVQSYQNTVYTYRISVADGPSFAPQLGISAPAGSYIVIVTRGPGPFYDNPQPDYYSPVIPEGD